MHSAGRVRRTALAHALDVCETENPTRDTTHRGARLTALSPVCRKRPFTTQADRLRLPRQRRSAAAQLSKAYLPVNISVQERAAANVSWYSKSGSSTLAACRSYLPRVSISSSIE